MSTTSNFLIFPHINIIASYGRVKTMTLPQCDQISSQKFAKNVVITEKAHMFIHVCFMIFVFLCFRLFLYWILCVMLNIDYLLFIVLIYVLYHWLLLFAFCILGFILIIPSCGFGDPFPFSVSQVSSCHFSILFSVWALFLLCDKFRAIPGFLTTYFEFLLMDIFMLQFYKIYRHLGHTHLHKFLLSAF